MQTIARETYVARLKRGEAGWAPYRVRSQTGQEIGELCLITHDLAADARTIEKLCLWRANHAQNFLTVLPVSLESTKNYLETIYLPDTSRLLFLLKESDRFVGNCGLANISENSAELDYIIRGETVHDKSFMVLAQIALIRWASEALHIETFYLRVLATNFKAIRSYERVGFKPVSSTPLRRQDFEDGYKLIPDPESPHTGLALLRMELRT